MVEHFLVSIWQELPITASRELAQLRFLTIRFMTVAQTIQKMRMVHAELSALAAAQFLLYCTCATTWFINCRAKFTLMAAKSRSVEKGISGSGREMGRHKRKITSMRIRNLWT